MKSISMINRCNVYCVSIILLLVRQAGSVCSFPLLCSKENISPDSLSVSCRDGGAFVYTDTVFRARQMAAVKLEFDSVAYCFKGMVDSIVPFRTPPEGDPCTSYLVDSVHVTVFTAYKGAVPDGFWFIDTIVPGYCDTTMEVWIEDGDPGYEKILHRDTFFVFTNDIGTLRSSNVQTGRCGYKAGYYITSSGNVYSGGVQYISSLRKFIDRNDFWITVPVKEFIDAFGTVLPSRHCGLSRTKSPSFSLVERQKRWAVISGKEQHLLLTLYGFDGRILYSRSVDCLRGQVIPLSGRQTVSAGIRFVRVSDGTTVNVFRIPLW